MWLLLGMVVAAANPLYGYNECYFPSDIDHGEYVRTINSTTALYECHKEYIFTRSTLDGLARCVDGVIQLPVCVDDLCYNVRDDSDRYPYNIDNGRRYYSHISGYNYKDIYYCYSGYMLSASTTKIRYYGKLYGLASCDYGIVDIPKCVKNRCPKAIQNGYQDGNNEGYYNCTEGYQFEDPTVFKCGEGEEVEIPACEPIECWYPDTIDGGRVTDNSTVYEDDEEIHYTCDEGYVMEHNDTDGTDYATACHNGTREIPVCIDNECLDSYSYPRYITNGYQYSRSFYGSWARYNKKLYTCNNGYMLSDNSTMSVLRYYGVIYGLATCDHGVIITPTCVKNQCNRTIPDGYQDGSNEGWYNCSAGYQFEDPTIRKCGDDGEEPVCDAIECWYPDTIDHGQMFDNSTKYDHDEDVHYYCDEGYTMGTNGSNDGVATCVNGTRNIPVCITDQCYNAEYALNITHGTLNTSTAERYYKGHHYEYKYNYYGNRYRDTVYEYGYRAYNNGTAVQYVCNEGYKLHQNSSGGVALCEDHAIIYPTCVHELDVMLVRKGNGHEVKVSFDNRTWGSICDDGWGDEDAGVVCKALGYKGGLALSMRGKSTIALSNFDCNGHEESLGLCAYNTYPSAEALPCKQNELAGVRCYHDEWAFYALIKKATVKTKTLIHIMSVHFKMVVKKFDISYDISEYLAPTFYAPNKTQQYTAQVKYNNKSGMYKAKLAVNSFEPDEHCITMVVTMPLFERYSETEFCLESKGDGNVTLSVN